MENTPANVKQVDALVCKISEDAHLGPGNVLALNKLVKGVKHAMADSTLLRITNTELITANTRKNDRQHRKGGTYGEARVLSLEDIKRRKEWAINKQKEEEDKRNKAKMKSQEQDLSKAFKELGRLGPDLLGQSNAAVPQNSPQKQLPSSQKNPQNSSTSLGEDLMVAKPTGTNKETPGGKKKGGKK